MTALETVCAIEMRNITKRFGSVTANDHIDFRLNRGEILALLGENGSGSCFHYRGLYRNLCGYILAKEPGTQTW